MKSTWLPDGETVETRSFLRQRQESDVAGRGGWNGPKEGLDILRFCDYVKEVDFTDDGVEAHISLVERIPTSSCRITNTWINMKWQWTLFTFRLAAFESLHVHLDLGFIFSIAGVLTVCRFFVHLRKEQLKINYVSQLTYVLIFFC